MNKLNVGDYVRTDTGIIEKLEGIHKQNKTNETIIKLNKMGGGRYAHIIDINSEFEKEFDKDFSRGNIIKSSPNIIDLIEVGDYVNGYKVDFTNINNKLSYEDKCIGFYDGDGDTTLFENDIKSMVTKEQFENISYKVGE